MTYDTSGFDLRERENYHTRPMPGGWLKQQDVARLADAQAEFDALVPLAELSVPAEVTATPEPLHAQVRFGREQSLPVASVSVRGSVGLICQRCLQPMTQQVDASARLALIEREEEAVDVPEDLEIFLAPEGRVSVAALVSEELLLALPLAPRHGEDEDCEVGAVVEEASEATETQRPFADLRELLKDRET
jgi:uncharacterized protein